MASHESQYNDAPHADHDGRISSLASTTPSFSSNKLGADNNNNNGQKGNNASFAYTPMQDGGSRRSLNRSQRDSWVHRFWFWEVFSILGALIALAAMVITLVLHQDKPLPKWPSAITINALIAVFSAILKACVVMPIAESISQLKWLWFQKARPLRNFEQWDLASRGSFKTKIVTGLHFKPFLTRTLARRTMGLFPPPFHTQRS